MEDVDLVVVENFESKNLIVFIDNFLAFATILTIYILVFRGIDMKLTS